ncbi:hypothetical protein MFIFM68171_07653 [Madurella fahalii]|uniref:Clr5 domain-containing protein n=1 Tax=Madurella fahalii TaxID=1157608 RepID=A0ABQ0GI54_9PEZI
MDRSLSPDDDGGPLALLAAAQSVTGLALDDEDDDDARAFIKEESSSPLPDNRKPLVLARMRQPPKFKPGLASRRLSGPPAGRAATAQHHLSKPAKHGRTAAASKAVVLRGAHPPQVPAQPVVPRRIEDWEPWKAVLHDLYITRNRILRDIISIMETEYNLRATPKMYKNQFARWGFFKYAVKRRPRTKTASPTEQRQDDSPEGGAIILSRDVLMYDSDGSRSMQVGLSAVRRFLHGHMDLDPANRTAEEVAGFIDPCYRYFKAAMDLFDLKENIAGGRVLRLAFLQIERKISRPTMKSFSDLCFLVPHLLLESNRKDILAAYLRYLTRLATVKFGKHPVTELAASFAAMVDHPEQIMRYIMLLSQVNSDTISNVSGILERTARWARYQYLACQRTNMTPGDDTGPWQQQPLAATPDAATPDAATPDAATAVVAVGRDRHDHHMIRLEAQSVYWAQNLVIRDPESDELAEQWLRRQFGEDFAPRCEALLAKLRARAAEGEFSPYFAKMVECLYVGWLSDYYETVRDWEKVFEWGRKGLSMSKEEQYVIWSIHLEELMRRYGNLEEAEELKRRRRAHVWLERVRVEVDRLSIA